jgi:hypothetical protein
MNQDHAKQEAKANDELRRARATLVPVLPDGLKSIDYTGNVKGFGPALCRKLDFREFTAGLHDSP